MARTQYTHTHTHTHTDAAGLLRRVPAHMPMLVLWGHADRSLDPTIAQDITAACELRGMHCTLVSVPDAGHCPHDDGDACVSVCVCVCARALVRARARVYRVHAWFTLGRMSAAGAPNDYQRS